MMTNIRILFLVLCALFMLGSAKGAQAADCSLPDGAEGEVIYNDDHNMVQFCDGTAWIKMGSSGGADSKVGTLTANKWCQANGAGDLIDCTADLPAATAAGAAGQVQFNNGSNALAADAGLVYTLASKTLTLGGATITTASAPVLNMTQTWNDSGVTFTGVKLNVTDTASAAASLLMDLQVGGTSYASVLKSGVVRGTQMITNHAAGTTGTSAAMGGGAGGVFLASDYSLGWSSLSTTPNTNNIFSGTKDLILARDAANILAQRNGTNAQEKRIYNTDTASDDEFVSMGYQNNANVFTIESEKTGAGTVRNIALMGGNVGIGTTTPAAGYRLEVVGGHHRVTGGQIMLTQSTPSNTLLITNMVSGQARIHTNAAVPIALSANSSSNPQLVLIDGGNIGVGTATPKSLLNVASSGYAQFSKVFAGAPTGTDCDHDDEIGRVTYNTAANTWYVCEGAADGWGAVAAGSSGITALTGDVTASGTGSVAATIADDAVTFAKMQNIATARLLGRATASSGNVEEITLGTGLSFTGTTLNVSGVGVSDGDKGDITVGSTGTDWQIDADAVTTAEIADGTIAEDDLDDAAVTYAKIQDVTGLSVLGRSANSTGTISGITAASDHEVLRRSGTSIGFGAIDLSSSNAVTGVLDPANMGTGTADGTTFLRGDGTWATPSGGSGTVEGTGAANHVAYWTDTDEIAHDANQLFWNATDNRLGIGTPTPGTALDVVGTVRTDVLNLRVVDGAEPPVGGAVAGGAAGQVQFNIGGALTGDSNFNWDNTNKRLSLGTTTNEWRNDGDDASPTPSPDAVAINASAGGGGQALGLIAGTTGVNINFHLPNLAGNRVRVAGLGMTSGVQTTGAEAGHLRFMTKAATDSGFLERVRIDSTGKVGIGTTGPGALLHLNSTVTGTSSEVLRVSRTDETSGGTAFGNTAAGAIRINDPVGGSRWSIGAYSHATGGDRVVYTTQNGFDHTFEHAGNERMRITDAGNVGIGTNNPNRLLHIRGANPYLQIDSTATNEEKAIQFTENGAVNWTILSQWSVDEFFIQDADASNGARMAQNASGFTGFSDRRAKENIKPVSVLDRLDDYRAVSFDWKASHNHDIGVIAQEFYKVFPELVTVGSDDKDGDITKVNDPRAWGVRYDLIGSLALQGVKELKAENDAVKAENTALKAQLDQLAKRLEALEARQ